MRVDRLLYPITTLGPGKRIVVWTSGCSKRCRNCDNPELWESSASQEVRATALAREIMRIHDAYGADEITITGGDPLEQSEDLEELLTGIRPQFGDVLVYTGFTLDEVEALLSKQRYAKFEKLVDVLVDGRYDDDKNDGASALRGSSNQRVVFFSDGLKGKYEEYMFCGRAVQNVAYNGQVVSVGIHNREQIQGLSYE